MSEVLENSGNRVKDEDRSWIIPCVAVFSSSTRFPEEVFIHATVALWPQQEITHLGLKHWRSNRCNHLAAGGNTRVKWWPILACWDPHDFPRPLKWLQTSWTICEHFKALRPLLSASLLGGWRVLLPLAPLKSLWASRYPFRLLPVGFLVDPLDEHWSGPAGH